MQSPLPSRFVLLFAACLPLALGACADQQRPVYVVIESGNQAMEKADYQRAATEFREAVSRRPGEIEGRRGLAQALLELDRPAEAREQAELVYSTRPSDPASVELLATAMLRSGDTAGMQSLVRGRANDTNSPDDWLLLGRLLAEAGDADGAEVALLTAAKVDQGRSLEYQRALADFYLAVGDTAKAMTRYRMALYLDASHEPSREAIRSLGQIPGPTMALPPLEAR